MMKKIVALGLLVSSSLLSVAHAGVVKIEVTGNLDFGTDTTNVFGYGTNQSLVGKLATLTWLIDLDRLTVPTSEFAYSVGYGCGGALCSTNKLFMSASVKINDITQTLDYQYPYTYDNLLLNSDWDGAGTFGEDSVNLRVGYTRNAGDWYQDASNNWQQFSTGLDSSIGIVIRDKKDSLLNGLGLAQLADLDFGVLGGSSDAGSAVFVISEKDKNFRSTRFATGGFQLNGASISWWDSNPITNGPGNTVPEPSALALLGLGLGLMGWTARRKG